MKKISLGVKNEVVIILDSEATPSIQIGKMMQQPPTQEARNAMMVLDAETIQQALLIMFRDLHVSGIRTVQESCDFLSQDINDFFNNPNTEDNV
jgi:hypothetical protein